ncbi:hypothetical protein [Modicisalibacter luteus]|uniref:Uncharacterized protein n=1 Tax=Modicisalibacter luteus TaxID=453962 RepID=A0ABV7LZQ5_9GAMM|nr:hypothetical protein [Halomonas lutea]GHA94534.1 hypothetical protein GCM10007159_15350 [Halomonas lutea]
MSITDELKSAITEYRLAERRYPESITVTPVKMAELMQHSLEQAKTTMADTDPNLFMGVEIQVNPDQDEPIVVQR